MTISNRNVAYTIFGASAAFVLVALFVNGIETGSGETASTNTMSNPPQSVPAASASVTEVEARLDSRLSSTSASPWRRLGSGNYERDLPNIDGSFQISASQDGHVTAVDYFSNVPRYGRNSLKVLYPARALVGALRPGLDKDSQRKIAATLTGVSYSGEFARGADDEPGASFWVEADDKIADFHGRL